MSTHLFRQGSSSIRLGLLLILSTGPAFAEPASRRKLPEPPADLHVLPPEPATEPKIPLPEGILAWDTETREITLTSGVTSASFDFTLRNISNEPVTLRKVVASCGCTVVKLPEQTRVEPGSSARIDGTMDLKAKFGDITKSVTVTTDQGEKTLRVIAHLPPAATEREKNQERAMADRQGIFQGACATCHARPARGKSARELFVATCAICHEAEPRAAMVPDLRNRTRATDPAYWKEWLTYGKPGTLMPAFAASEGGILTDAQITSLVEYLTSRR